ncbi:MAG: fumarylacetoacetase [Phycisphaerales bacterium]|nr:fumarylacetoacetase [Phycisphaerales bacterium]
MPYPIDETHDPSLRSWVDSANDPDTDFPIQNLPLCAFRVDGGRPGRVGTRIGDQLLDLAMVEDLLGTPTLLHHGEDRLFESGLSGLLRQPRLAWSNVRRTLVRLLTDRAQAEKLRPALLPECDAQLLLTHPVGDYTDFYASVYHATNVGSMFRPDNALLPNYKWLPVGYHGRASSIVPSGTPITRPRGQQSPADDGGSPTFAPCKMLDYELEIGVIIARGNDLGRPIPMSEAEHHILGLCLLNDWSARDVQKWEYQPLGPFLAKNFATTVSPYIVTMEALAPFRAPAMERPPGDPQPLGHLDCPANRSAGGFDITLEVHLASSQMRDRGLGPVRLSKGNFRDMYWTVAQMIAHHTSNGCNLQPGDLLGSGTVSGPTRDSRGCLLELTWDGDPFAHPPLIKPGSARTPIALPTGETRTFLQDGDEVTIKGYCQRSGFRRIGFGQCRGVITPAHP